MAYKNKKKKAAWAKKYEETHKAERSAAGRRLYQRTKEKRRIQIRIWREKNKEKVRAYAQKAYWKQPEKMRERSERWRKANPEKRKAAAFRRRLREWGITEQEYQALLLKQHGCCAICERPPSTKRLAIDHDHITDKMRGLLCSDCNTAIGLAKDNVDILLRMIQYLNGAR